MTNKSQTIPNGDWVKVTMHTGLVSIINVMSQDMIEHMGYRDEYNDFVNRLN